MRIYGANLIQVVSTVSWQQELLCSISRRQPCVALSELIAGRTDQLSYSLLRFDPAKPTDDLAPCLT